MKIGVLEDDPMICNVLTEILELDHHAVSIFRRGWDILYATFFEEVAVNPLPFDVLLVDLLLEGEISGVQVIAQMHRSFPNLPVIVISAVSSNDLENVQRMYPHVQVIRKPFSIEVLRAALEIAASYT